MEKITYSAQTDIGKCRERNDDAVCSVPEIGFFAVADGIGQLAFGGVTAEYTCKLMANDVENIYQNYRIHLDDDKAGKELKTALETISNKIFQKANTPDVYRYGTTFCGMMCLENQLLIVNIGDSRAYVKKKGQTEIFQITEDHNLAVMASKNGYMTYEEAVERGLASRILNFVGISENTEADLFVVDRAEVEKILLCSDGLSGMASVEEIAACVEKKEEPDSICRELIQLANQKGGKDNISVVLVQFDDCESTLNSD